MATELDDTDRRLLALLRSDGRASLAILARQLHVSRGTVQNRMRRLEADGIVVGYTVKLKPTIDDQRMRALMTIAVEGHRTAAVVKTLRGDPAIVVLHTTNGRWDIVAELRVETLADFDRVLTRVRAIEGVSNSETSILLNAVKL